MSEEDGARRSAPIRPFNAPWPMDSRATAPDSVDGRGRISPFTRKGRRSYRSALRRFRAIVTMRRFAHGKLVIALERAAHVPRARSGPHRFRIQKSLLPPKEVGCYEYALSSGGFLSPTVRPPDRAKSRAAFGVVAPGRGRRARAGVSFHRGFSGFGEGARPWAGCGSATRRQLVLDRHLGQFYTGNATSSFATGVTRSSASNALPEQLCFAVSFWMKQRGRSVARHPGGCDNYYLLVLIRAHSRMRRLRAVEDAGCSA
jgi:hypothetical protein